MNWKQEAVERLREYSARRQALDSIPGQIQQLDSEYAGLRAACTDREAVSGGGGNREDALLSNIVSRQQLTRQLQETRLWIATVDGALAILTEEEKLILELFYIHQVRHAAEDLCQRLNVERATVYRWRDTALRRFTLALYGATET